MSTSVIYINANSQRSQKFINDSLKSFYQEFCEEKSTIKEIRNTFAGNKNQQPKILQDIIPDIENL